MQAVKKIQTRKEITVMVQGDELRANLKNVLAMIREYENNYMQRAALENQVRGEIAEQVEVAELDFSGGKGKAKMTALAVVSYIVILLVLASVFGGMASAWVPIIIAAVVAVIGFNTVAFIGVIAAIVAVVMILYMIYGCVIEPTIRAFATGNITALLILAGLTALLVLIIYLVNHKLVNASNARIRRMNKEIRKANQEIQKSNAQLVQQATALYNRAKELDQALQNCLSPHGFYPKRYVYEQAAAWFVNYMDDLEAGTPITMQQLIELYKSDMHNQRVEAQLDGISSDLNDLKNMAGTIIGNQERQLQMLQVSNMIGMYQCYQNSVLNSNVAAIRDTANNAYERMTRHDIIW